MKFAHVMVLVSDMEKAKRLWCDVLGFIVIADTMLPDGEPPENYFTKEVFEDVWGAEGSASHMVCIYHPEGGAVIELQHPKYPDAVNPPRDEHGYRHCGIREIAFNVSHIDSWYEKIKAAGYEMQTDYVFTTAGGTRSFLFYDDDGNLIQLCELPNN